MALKLTLKPGEKFVINGAVVQNGDRRVTVTIENKASILRSRDVMLPGDANTPVKRIYFAVMLLYLGEGSESEAYDEFVQRMAEFFDVLLNKEVMEQCLEVIRDVNTKNYYRALMLCKKLMPYEKERLEYVPGEVPEDASDDQPAAS
jgi:flagellar biosynthesis repressor protein FlbT